MAKVINIIITEEGHDYELLENYLNKKGFQYTVSSFGSEAPKAEEKPAKKATTSKKSAPKKDTKAKASTKKSDGFNTELYHEVAKKLGVIGKKGVWKFARQTVYDGMAEVEKSGKMSAKVYKALMAQLLTEAQRLGLQWYIDMVAEDKKAAK